MFVWDEDKTHLSFVGRTIRLDTGERTENGIKVEVDFDRPIAEIVNPPPKAGQGSKLSFA